MAPYGWVYPQRGQIWGYVRNAKIYRCPSDFGRAAVKITNVPAGMSNKDYPGIVHYNGTTLSYLDGHAAWKPRTTLIAEYLY